MPITDSGVDTLAFLEAAGGLVGMFGTNKRHVSFPNCGSLFHSHKICLDRQLSR